MYDNRNLGINFCKYTSCGNDFIIVDDRKLIFPLGGRGTDYPCGHHKFYIESVCDREHGIGADGFILLWPAPKSSKAARNYLFQGGADSIELTNNALYVMVYFNADGNVSSFCGNGSMCCAHFAASIGLCVGNVSSIGSFRHRKGLFSFQTDINTRKTKISMMDVVKYDIENDGVLIDTGSPHYVIFKSDLNKLDVEKEGKKIRYSDRFLKDGINVTFAAFFDDTLSIRTYERGVESETLSCGTGAVAAGLCVSIYNLTQKTHLPVHTQGGVLEVGFTRMQKSFTNIYLESVVEKNFEGILPNL